jgi:hypothetical protein
MERGRRPERRLHAARTGERGTHPVLIALAAVIVLVIAVVIFLLLQKPKQVTPVAVIGTSPSASAAATPTAVPVTLSPTVAPTPTPTPRPRGTSPAFASFNAPRKVACNGQSVIDPHMTWSVVNATGITISIDTPDGIYDSYGTSGATDQQSDPVPFACSKTPLEHMYFFTTTGGTGPEVTKEVTITGTP